MKTIVLDAEHGGNYDGTINGRSKEVALSYPGLEVGSTYEMTGNINFTSVSAPAQYINSELRICHPNGE